MEAMVTLITLISWYSFAVICDSLNADEDSSQAPHKRKLRTSSYDEICNDVQTWTCPVEHSAGHLSESDKWNIFLNSLYCKLSEYEIQKFKRNYNVANIEDWGNPDASNGDTLNGISNAGEIPKNGQGIEITEDNFQKFLDEIEPYHIMQLDNIRDITIKETQLEELNHILHLTIKQGIDISCNEPYMFIKGDYVLLSDMINKHFSLSINATEGKCKALLEAGRLKFLNIFALNTIFIDAHILKNDIFQAMTVIAPKWQFIGSRERIIDFSGNSGDALSENDQAFIPGADGRPGMPGQPGKILFGIAKDLFGKDAALSIMADGGQGGPGEDGKNGRNGDDGMSASIPTSETKCERHLCDNSKTINFFKCQNLGCSEERYRLLMAHRQVKTKLSCDYRLFGHKGSIGGDGGNGGKGGIGGNPGSAELIQLTKSSSSPKIFQTLRSGLNGADGEGGIGGYGGEKGEDIIVHCEEADPASWSLKKTESSKERNTGGENGLRGKNSEGIFTPTATPVLSKLDKAKIINQYKSYLRENLSNRFQCYSLVTFLKQLEENNEVKHVYDTSGLADDLRSLEEHFNMLTEVIDLRPLYQSLLRRIIRYTQSFAENEDTSLYKKILGYLYTTTLSRINNFDEELESKLIIDISKYLNSVKEDIEKLKDLQNTKIKVEVINKYKQEYKKEIDAKIKEATDIIGNDIMPEISDAAHQNNVQIELLLTQVIRFQQEAVKNNKLLNQRKRQLENLLVLQNSVSILKVFGTLLSFIGTGGAVASVIVGNVATNMEGSNTISDSVNIAKISVPEFEKQTDKIQKIRDQKIANLNKSVEIISQEAKKFPSTFSNISAQVSNISHRLDEMSEEMIKSSHFNEIENMETELKEILRTKESELLILQRDTGAQQPLEEVVAIQHMQKAFELSSLLLDTYKKHSTDSAKLSEINKAIDKNEEIFYELKKFEDKIYDTIMPMVQNMQSDINSIISTIAKKSKVVLDVAKWKVESTLKDAMVELRQFTAGFDLNDKLMRSIEKLKEGTTTLINVYDHIQDLQNAQTLANYIAGINSITVRNTPLIHNTILEGDLKHIFNDLQMTLSSSIIVQRYKVAFGAFKQFVFPFANLYLRDLMLPTNLKLVRNEGKIMLDNLVFKAVTEMEKIIKISDRHKQIVNGYHQCIFSGEFTSRILPYKPFFMWENTKHKEMIKNLLSGKTVTVKADVTGSEPDKDAIKFNAINFHFKSIDGTNQSEIDKALKNFQITAVHLGNSDYRYKNKTYLMTTPILEISYDLQKNLFGEPVRKSYTYDQIKNGDFVLSPYASWNIRLDSITEEVSFKILRRYNDKINLELEGYGSYVNKRKQEHCPDLKVNKYYTVIDEYYNGIENF